jgi:hypothetical protein
MSGKQRAWACTLSVIVLSALASCGRSGNNPTDTGAESPACVVNADCTKGERCEAGLCVENQPEAGGGSGDLGDGGQASVPVPVEMNAGAGGEAGQAPVAECEPGGRSCDGPSVRVCAADGTSHIETTCSPSQVCSGGECHAIQCVPGATFCKDGLVLSCSDDGLSSSPSKACSAGQFCVEHDGAAECSDTVCTPKSGLCVNSVATQCKADGSGPEPGGKDCTAKNLVCNEGECADPTCAPGEKLCEHDDVYLCIGGGTAAVLFTDCAADEVCDPGLVACRKRICEPGKLGCDDSRVATCNALGTGWDQSGSDCASSNQVCVAGACQAKVCVPGATFCKDGNVNLCDAKGLSSSVSQTCSAYYYHCAESGNSAYCYYNTCTPGSAVCNGNVATVCKADGSGFEPGGTDCGADKLCSSGICAPKVCDAYTYFCKDGDVNYCQGGLSSYVAQDCGSDARCLKVNQSATCVPYDCSPGLKACIGNQVGTCADDGTSLASVKQDCGLANQVCVSSSACGDSAVDTLGAAEELQSLASNSVFGDVIDVESNRQLTELEANLVLASSRDLRFVVYEAVNGYFIARYDQVVNGVANSGYASSGAISYTLKAGRRYLLGVAVSGGGFVPYYDALPWQPEASFGRAVGVLSSSYATSLYAGYVSTDRLYDLRITTQLP